MPVYTSSAGVIPENLYSLSILQKLQRQALCTAMWLEYNRAKSCMCLQYLHVATILACAYTTHIWLQFNSQVLHVQDGDMDISDCDEATSTQGAINNKRNQNLGPANSESPTASRCSISSYWAPCLDNSHTVYLEITMQVLVLLIAMCFHCFQIDDVHFVLPMVDRWYDMSVLTCCVVKSRKE